MSSAVSRDDVESEIWRTGVKSPHRIKQLMNVIDAYAFGMVRASKPETNELLPGESDFAERKTRCDKCMVVKDWKYFSADLRVKSGHKSRCMACCGPVRNVIPYSEGKRKHKDEYLCRKGEHYLPIGEFDIIKTYDRAKPIWCIKCMETHGIQEDHLRWPCPVCHKRRLPDEFPKEKRLHSRRDVTCLICKPQ
jgi:hypothetical protein